MSRDVSDDSKVDDASDGERWAHGFPALVRVGWLAPDAAGEIQYGAGVIATSSLVLTAKHVLERYGDEAWHGDVRIFHEASRRTVACEEVLLHTDLDLALLRLSEPLPAADLVWLNGGNPFDHVPSGTIWRGYGYPLASGGTRACQHPLTDPHPSPSSDASGSLVRILIAKGLPRGYSGGPVFLECGANRLLAGIGKLGGDGASVTEVLPSDELLKFLAQQAPSEAALLKRKSAVRFFAEPRASESARARYIVVTVGMFFFLANLLVSGQHSLNRNWFTDLWLRASCSVFLGTPPQADKAPVVIVDVSELGREERGGDGKEFTARDQLIGLLAALAEFSPSAIGVAIDLSPEVDAKTGGPGLPTASTLRLLDACQRSTRPDGTPLPIAVGVYRTQMLEPSKWLGRDIYTNLAAHLSRPRGVGVWMPAQLEVGDCAPLPGLATWLASRYWSTNAGPTVFERLEMVRRFVGSSDRTLRPPARFKHFLVDPTPWSTIQEATVRISPTEGYTAQLIRWEQGWSKQHPGKPLLANRVVIVGLNPREEKVNPVNLPGLAEPVNGVLLQACAFWTLTGRPVWSLALWVEALGFAVLLTIVVWGPHWTRGLRGSLVIAAPWGWLLGGGALLVGSLALAGWARVVVLDVGAMSIAWVTAAATTLWLRRALPTATQGRCRPMHE